MHAFVLTAFVLVCLGVIGSFFTAVSSASPHKRALSLAQLAVGVGLAVWGAKLLWF